VTDAEEGLIVVDVMPLADGEPRNNFLKRRALTWNPDGGAGRRDEPGDRGATRRAYVCTPKGLVIVALDDPLSPSVVSALPLAKAARSRGPVSATRFVIDEEGLKGRGHDVSGISRC